MTPLTIAPAEPGDLQTILALDRSAPEAPHWTPAHYHAILSPPPDAIKRCLLVATTTDEITGFAVGKLVAGEAELETVVVSLTQRRRGIGRALCTAVIAWAWERGALRIELEARVSSAGAIALYRSLGFAIVGRRPNYYPAPVEDAVLMRLER